MLVLHGSPQPGGLFVWGETSPESGVRPGRRRSSKARKEPSTSPFDAGAAACRSALDSHVVDVPLQAAAEATCTVWLPTAHGCPLPSSALVADVAPANGDTSLAQWLVSGLLLPLDESIALLSALWDREMLAPGINRGHTIGYWATVMRFAGSLVSREQFLPTIRREGDSFHACWQPIIAGEDARRLVDLVRCLPPVCRASCCVPDDGPPAMAAGTLVNGFIDGVVDHLVRSAASAELAPAAKGRKRPAFDSLHDQWLHALRAADSTLVGETGELARFCDQVRDWQRPVALTVAAPFRLCFRLEEPPSALEEPARAAAVKSAKARNGSWQVRYLLQGVEDPSLLIPAEEAWNSTTQAARLLKKHSFQPREYLLSALGSASTLDADIEHSLKGTRPAGYALDTTAAYNFLSEKAWALEQAGFGVLLPAWWTRKGTKQQLTVHAQVKSPKMQGHAGLSLDDLVEFDWRVALGDEPISQSELEALARMKVPLVSIRGKWVHLSAEEIQAAIEFWKKKGSETTVRELVKMSLGAAQPPAGLEFGGVQASGWIADFLQQLDGRTGFAELDVPPDFHGTLRPYQVRGYSWLGFLRRWGLGACLADDMGLGKTVQALTLIQREWAADPGRPVLLVCPMSVVGNWHKEAERFTPDLPVLVHHGLKRLRNNAAFRKSVDGKAIVLVSYALLHRDFEQLQSVRWRGVVLDEAQNIKNPETKQSKAARSLQADYRIALTGTPVENHVGDLWSIMEFLNPGFLGSQAEFRRRYYYPIHTNQDSNAAGRLRKLTGPFILRRLKTDKSIIADLPQKMEMKVFCNLTREQASLYAAVVEDAMKALEGVDGIQRKGVVLATLSKLKQVCNHPAHFLGDNSPLPGRSGKLARLSEMLEEVLDEGDRALVFTQFTEMGTLLRKHLQETFGQEVLFLHGGLSRAQRDHAVTRFHQEDGPRIFLLSLKAGGTGLNLTAANHVFHFDRWWNPAVESQATDRAFRIGQKKNVQVHKFICAGTLEDRIDAMIERKTTIAAQVVGAGEAWLTELSTAALKDLFALRQEAVAE